MEIDNQPKEEMWKRLLQYFFQGIITIAPIGVTLYVVFWLFTLIDNFLPNLFSYFFPYWMMEPDGSTKQIPGLGFLLMVVVVMIIGRLSSLFLVNRVLGVLDNLLEKTPGIKYIYTSVKDFLQAFGGNRKKFDKPVMVNVDAQPVWRIGFITQEEADKFELPEHVAVYVPHSYAISGILYFVPKTHIRPLHNVSSAEAMKTIISGGVTHLEEHAIITPAEEQTM